MPKAVFNKTGNQVVNLVKKSQKEEVLNLILFGEISSWWNVNKNEVYLALQNKAVTQINVYISSPGGEASEGFAIHDLLKGHTANVTTYGFGLVASAATFILLAGDDVKLSKQCVFMIHQASMYSYGNTKDLEKSMNTLKAYDSVIRNLYQSKTGLSQQEVTNLVEAESWMEPEEALRLGFVDEIVDSVEIDMTVEDTGTGYWQDDYYWEIWDSADGNDFEGRIMNNAVINLANNGIKPLKKEAPEIINKSKIQNSNLMKWLKDILNQGISAFTKGDYKAEEVEKAVEDLMKDEKFVQSAENSMVDARIEAKLKEINPAKNSILEDLDSLSDEDLAKLKEKLGLGEQAETEEVSNKAELEKQIEEVKAEYDQKLSAIKAEISGQRAKAPKSKSNGNLIETEEEPKGAVSAAGQLAGLVQMYQSGDITAAQYKQFTGKEAPRKN